MAVDQVKTTLPPIRACIFDMDGLLINSEDLYSVVINSILADFGKPPMPWSVKARLQGRPAPEAAKVFSEWAKLPISVDEFRERQVPLQEQLFKTTAPLPGVLQLLGTLVNSKSKSTSGSPPKPIEIALATSSHEHMFKIKTQHLSDLFDLFPPQHRVLGDDPRIGSGRGKPLPDIFLLALESINNTLRERGEGDNLIKPEECLVFEDAVPGVEAARRAGMRAVWCPYAGLLEEYKGREKEVLAGRTNEHRGLAGPSDGKVGEIDDGFADLIGTLENFPYEKYGIVTLKDMN